MKRKADISLDECLARGVSPSGENQIKDINANKEQVEGNCATATQVLPEWNVGLVVGVSAEVAGPKVEVTGLTAEVAGVEAKVAGPTAEVARVETEVAISAEESAEWFWRLLEQLGYERW